MTIKEKLHQYGVVPVIVIDDPENALPLVDALAEAELPIVEITLRTQSAIESIKVISKYRPNILVGAGTVLSEQQLDLAIDAGAQFGLAPGLDLFIVDKAKLKKFEFIPGVMTPTEIQTAIKAGCSTLKFFPASPAGGPKMLKSIAAPFEHLGLRFNPTGGISSENLSSWLDLKEVAAVGGSWIATRDQIRSGDWQTIKRNASESIKIARGHRGGL